MHLYKGERVKTLHAGRIAPTWTNQPAVGGPRCYGLTASRPHGLTAHGSRHHTAHTQLPPYMVHQPDRKQIISLKFCPNELSFTHDKLKYVAENSRLPRTCTPRPSIILTACARRPSLCRPLLDSQSISFFPLIASMTSMPCYSSSARAANAENIKSNQKQTQVSQSIKQ